MYRPAVYSVVTLAIYTGPRIRVYGLVDPYILLATSLAEFSLV